MAEHGIGRPLSAAFRRAWKGEKIVTLAILFVLLTAAIAGMTAVLTGPDWASLWVSLLIGLLTGWILAIVRWRAWRAAVLVLVLGILFCLLFAGQLDVNVGSVLAESARLVGSVPGWIKTGRIDLAPLGGAFQQFFSAIDVVLGRVAAWVTDLTSGRPAFDPVAAAVVWSLVVWLVSAWAGWFVEAGHSALIAVLPALSLDLATLSYGRYNSVSIYLMLGLTLVLIAVVHFDQREQEWDATRVAYPQRKSRQVGNTSLLIAIGLVVLAALISSISLQKITEWTAQLNQSSSQSQSGLAKSLGIQQPTAVPNSFSRVRSPGLPRELLIGASPQLLSEPVMSVEVTYLSNLDEGSRLPPLYWRSYTYDTYSGHGWSASPTSLTQYLPDQPLQAANLPDHLPIQEVVVPVPNQTGTIYAAGEPVSVNVATTAAWRTSNDLFGIQTNDAGYTVQSLLAVASEGTLRAAGQDYPTWVAERYLSLPAEVTNRVRQLAIQLTATQPTPYDRAHAIEQYLRSTYPYTIDVPYPPTDQDLVDYFLFDLRKGYCDYYASAMVVLARAAGLPARLAVGYATGTYNLSSGRFIVTQAEAHSWAEIYFPGIGWVPFEPTAGRPGINRSAQSLQQPTPAVTPVKTPPTAGPTSTHGNIIGFVALGLVPLALLLWAATDEIFLRQLRPQAAAGEIYRRIRRYGRLLYVPDQDGQTPYEYSAALIATLEKAAPARWAVSSGIADQVQAIIERVVRLGYRPSEAGEVLKGQILHQWQSLRWQLRLRWLIMMWGVVQGMLPTKPGRDADKMEAVD